MEGGGGVAEVTTLPDEHISGTGSRAYLSITGNLKRLTKKPANVNVKIM